MPCKKCFPHRHTTPQKGSIGDVAHANNLKDQVFVREGRLNHAGGSYACSQHVLLGWDVGCRGNAVNLLEVVPDTVGVDTWYARQSFVPYAQHSRWHARARARGPCTCNTTCRTLRPGAKGSICAILTERLGDSNNNNNNNNSHNTVAARVALAYLAESLSWYSLRLEKHACTPPSFQSARMAVASVSGRPVAGSGPPCLACTL